MFREIQSTGRSVLGVLGGVLGSGHCVFWGRATHFTDNYWLVQEESFKARPQLSLEDYFRR